jgi:hypothetical protein
MDLEKLHPWDGIVGTGSDVKSIKRLFVKLPIY